MLIPINKQTLIVLFIDAIVDTNEISTDIKAAIAVLISALPIFAVQLDPGSGINFLHGLFLKWKRFMLKTGIMEKNLYLHRTAESFNGNARRSMT
jgi:hypothetical protein